MIILAATGYLQVRAYASTALIPLMDVAILITDPNGAVIANRLTNRNGLLDAPIPITVPDRSESLQPSAGSVPFTKINLYARLEGYEEIEAENASIANQLAKGVLSRSAGGFVICRYNYCAESGDDPAVGIPGKPKSGRNL